MGKTLVVGLILAILAVAANAGQVVDGVLMVNGKPFYPLGSWNSDYTTPEDIARLGMNTSFRGGPSTPEAVETFRELMRECDQRGIQVVPYLSYGGAGVQPWAPEAVRAIAKLATEPNLLAWYVGDDIGMQHLPGIRQTVDILRENTPTIPTVADYIAKETPEAKTVFTQYIDIRCQYAYPIPDETFAQYLEFFDRQREFVGDPLWTWVQSFMWGRTGRALNVGAEGPGPVPDPEQVRLLAFAAINRGVRGLLFFPHHELHRLPELAAEVALTCREIRLFESHLAAGTTTFNLPTSLPEVNATAFQYGNSTVISAAVFKPSYHRWVDADVLKDVSIDCPWADAELPQAVLTATPDMVPCSVSIAPNPEQIRVTLPSLEIAGFVLITNDNFELTRVRRMAMRIPKDLRTLIMPAAAAQHRKVSSVVWQLGRDNLYSTSDMMDAVRAQDACAAALDRRDYDAAVRAWRALLRADRKMLDDVMRYAEAHQDMLSPSQQAYLASPYGLQNIPGLGDAPPADDPRRFIREYLVAGPFALDWDGKTPETPPGFARAYPPESQTRDDAEFETLDGKGKWKNAEADLSGLLRLLPLFKTTENVVCYAQCRVQAPREMDTKLSLGSNDGAAVFVNGKTVFSWSSAPEGGRSAHPHQNEIPVHLQAGMNIVVVKVENLGRDWQLYLAIHDPKQELKLELE
ncbi:MAG: hypothetical protein HY706_14335 [Candidatus Hydrogenedentes bacterium]|nr:hypothetical protein [Candidatus Hydrogenedentota bacterium]